MGLGIVMYVWGCYEKVTLGWKKWEEARALLVDIVRQLVSDKQEIGELLPRPVGL